jgi:hypothetical protein
MSKVTLFFIAGTIPTAAERAAAEKVGATRFRNAKLAINDPIEKCDAVAGLVPESYKGVKGIEVLDIAVEEPKADKQPAGKK